MFSPVLDPLDFGNWATPAAACSSFGLHPVDRGIEIWVISADCDGAKTWAVHSLPVARGRCGCSVGGPTELETVRVWYQEVKASVFSGETQQGPYTDTHTCQGDR